MPSRGGKLAEQRGKLAQQRGKLAQQREEREEYDADYINSGYRVKSKKAKKEDQEEENRRLKHENQNLRAMLFEYQDKHRKCVREHGIMDVKKKEPLDSDSSSNSVKVKAEPCIETM